MHTGAVAFEVDWVVNNGCVVVHLNTLNFGSPVLCHPTHFAQTL